MAVPLCLMENEDEYKRRAAALIAEVNGAIASSGYTPKSLAEKLGMDYNTLLRYLNSKRSMPLPVFYRVVEQLNVTEETLTKRAREQLDRK